MRREPPRVVLAVAAVAAAVAAGAAAGCRHEWDGGAEAAPPSPASSVRADEWGPPEPMSLPAIDAVCKNAPCSGALAQVTPFYDAKNRIAFYAHDGDVQRCPGPPTAWFDRDASPVAHPPRAERLTKGAPQTCRKP